MEIVNRVDVSVQKDLDSFVIVLNSLTGFTLAETFTMSFMDEHAAKSTNTKMLLVMMRRYGTGGTWAEFRLGGQGTESINVLFHSKDSAVELRDLGARYYNIVQ